MMIFRPKIHPRKNTFRRIRNNEKPNQVKKTSAALRTGTLQVVFAALMTVLLYRL